MAGIRTRTVILWIVAVIITLGAAVWQRVSGPTYPVRGTVTLGGQDIDLELLRSHGGEGDQPVIITAKDETITGTLAFRRYPTQDDWWQVDLVREGDLLAGVLPHQPPAGKLEYQVRLRRAEEEVSFPSKPAITRFKGDVSLWILIPHVLAMFLAMLYSTRAGLAALALEAAVARLTKVTLGLFLVGGFILGPLLQKAAFGAYWTGFPYGHDLTDNKVLIAAVVWVVAFWRLKVKGNARLWIALAALVTFAIFLIPHSAWGSEIDWSTMPAPTGD